MILSQFQLNLDSREARRDLGNPYDMHRTLSRLLTNSRCLWRLEERTVLLVSETSPDWTAIDASYFMEPPHSREYPVEKMKLENRRLRFKLLANPTKSIKEGLSKSSRGKRVQLIKEADLLEWLSRQGQRGGFRVESVTSTGNRNLRFRKKKGQTPVVLGTCAFEGTLHVEDAANFRKSLREGLGRAKAFGMGLLSVAPG